MIYLLTRQTDDTTVLVIQWLLAKGKEFKRLNILEDIAIDQLVLDNGGPLTEINNLWNSQADSFYFNGGNLLLPDLGLADQILNSSILRFVKNEVDAVLSYCTFGMGKSKQFGLSPYSTRRVNKLIVLQEAGTIGLSIPETAVVNSKAQLVAYKKRWPRMISKSIDSGVHIETPELLISGQRTIEVTEDIIDKMGAFFFPSLIQKLIEKQFEIRVFFHLEVFYSIAIFSQAKEATKVDSRNLVDGAPNREVPFDIPDHIKSKISALMKRIGLNYGSIDLIYTAEDKYCFLEVNPYGQYGFLSSSGNYYIEKQIAEFL